MSGVRLLGAIGGVLVARVLGPDLRGELAVIVVFGTVLGSASALGVHFWAIRTTAGVGPSTWVVRVLRRHFAVTTVGSLAAACAVFLVGVSPEWTALFALSAGWTFAALGLAIPSGMRRLRTVALAQGVGAAFYVIAILVLLTAGWDSVALAVLATAAAQWAIGGVGLAAWRDLRHRLVETDEGGGYRSVLRESVPGAVSDVLLLAAVRLDVVLVAAFADPVDVGLYAVALSVAELPMLAADATAQVALPFVSEDRTRRSVAAVHRVLILVAASLGLGLLVPAPFAVPAVFGDEYGGSVAPLPLLILGALFLGSWKLLVVDLSARGRNGVRAATIGVGVFTMVAVDVVLIPQLGPVGAAIGSMLGYGAAAVAAALSWRRDGRGKLADLYRIRTGDIRLIAQAAHRLRSSGEPAARASATPQR